MDVVLLVQLAYLQARGFGWYRVLLRAVRFRFLFLTKMLNIIAGQMLAVSAAPFIETETSHILYVRSECKLQACCERFYTETYAT